ncbi:MAG TPA: aminotransferase class I/II-fold pyridoxal phosphate-dependent enzyme [Symbiobacteriaceae bacterium]|nr:aminotransferase class I/II-fold pyridoxal phosphate-dependent enzyme [Symbiobacteriaceae bacterium]
MPLNQNKTPLFDAVKAYAETVRAAMHIPGHKLGQAAPADWRECMGGALNIDLTEAPGLDDLHAPEGVIAEAQALAAEAFGAQKTFFLCGGTTAGLHALILTACRPGDTIALPRHAHRSVLGALILSGARPNWVPVKFHEELDTAVGIHTQSLAKALDGSVAALLIHPSYYGVVDADGVAEQIRLIHDHGVPALIDEAHASHFHFHPALPPSTLSLGADGVVHSIHKTGGSLTQSSICHLGKNSRLDEHRLRANLRLVQTTSPSYLLTSSLDVARRELALNGYANWDRAIEVAQRARRRIAALRGLALAETTDPTKLLIDVRGRGLTGRQAFQHLWARGVAVESAGLGFLLAVMTPADTDDSAATLVGALAELPDGPGAPTRPPEPPYPEMVILPRDAFMGLKESVPLAESVGRIAAELVAPYPPGIPVVAPGERLTTDVVAYLRHAVASGHHLQGPADPKLTRIQVVKE